MTKTLQIRIDEELKKEVDELFEDLGLDTSTAVRMFFKAALDRNGLPFDVKRPNSDTVNAINDVLNRTNLYGPFDSAKSAIASILED